MRPRSRVAPLCTLAGIFALAAGCERQGGNGAAQGEVPEIQRYGGTAVVGGIVDLQSMNSLTVTESFARMFQVEVLFLPLLRYDARSNPVPVLAERWDTVRVTPDTLELTFRIRRDVQWHDGEAVDARDVAFTYDRVRDPRVASTQTVGFTFYSPRATVVDDHTVRFRLRPHAEFLDGWARLAIMPEHILADVPPPQLAAHPFGTQSPVGNGPFRFVRRIPGQEWVFEANPDFPEALGGRPYLDRLVYRVVPDQTSLTTEVLTGGIDLFLAVHPPQLEQLRASPDVELRSAPGPTSTFVAWNGRSPLFDTPEERRALSMAIDRNLLVNALLRQHGVAGRATVTPLHWSWDSEDPETTLPYSRDAARQLLRQAGWLDRDGDGILEDSAGRPFRFTLKTMAANQSHRDLAQILQAQLRELGIDMKTSAVEGHTLIGQISGRKNGRGEVERDFEAVVMGLTDNFRKDDSHLFHSRNLGGPMQISSFSHPRVDALLDTLGLIVDREQARPLWKEYQRLLAENAPHTVLYYPDRTIAFRKRLRGVEADARGELVSVTRWWIPPGERTGGGGVGDSTRAQ